MSATTTATATRGRTARKIIGSLGVVGAAAAVAGLGTFGTFTDSTTPLEASVTTGKLDINLNQAGTATLPMSVAGFVPGDSLSRAVDLTNDGDLAFSSLILNSTAPTSSILDTDKADGLQLTVRSCPVAWTASAPGTAATYSCESPTTLYADEAVPGGTHLDGRPEEPGRRRHRPPGGHPVAARERRRPVPGEDLDARPGVLRHPGHRHRPLTRRSPTR
ncbi:hypothetical protein A7K94_0211575 [Modestobacter sp. VKM Ac-2676]|nr:hypothetical protein A7K94_0211575 [Modestobacter sp. VKM Ac-2676]